MEALLQSHETRLARVEDTLVAIADRLGRLEARVDDICAQLPLMATREDLHAMEARLEARMEASMERHVNTMLKWMVGILLGGTIASVTVMTFVLNNATPRQAPIVLQLPLAR